MELRAGAFTASDRRLVRRLRASFEKAGRLLVPSAVVFDEAGDTLRLRLSWWLALGQG